MTLWDMLATWISGQSEDVSIVQILPDHVTDGALAGVRLQSEEAYFRLTLASMALKDDWQWFQIWHPVVNSLVRLKFGDQVRDIPNVAGHLSLEGVSQENIGKVSVVDYPLTGYIPFRGGTIGIEAALLGIKGPNLLADVLKGLSEVASLLTLAQVSAALNVAIPVMNGLQSILNGAGGQVYMGVHRTYSGVGGDPELKPGYLAVLLADDEQFQAARLWVKGVELREGPNSQANRSLDGIAAYMLFKIETFATRDDLQSLSSIANPRRKFQAAIDSLSAQEAETWFRTTIAAIHDSPDITLADRGRLITAIKDEYIRAKSAGLGVTATERSLDELVRATNLSTADAITIGQMSIEEVLNL